MKKWQILVIVPVCFLSGCADMDTARMAYIKGDYATAESNWSVLARRGFPEAQTRLAKMKMTGTGVAANPKEGVQLLNEAAKEDYPGAYIELGAAYRDGVGVPADPKKARVYLNKALALGEPGAHYQLGVLDSRENQLVSAEAQFRQALQAGDTNAYYQLGVMAERKGDMVGAEDYFGHAVAAGDKLAYYRRGRLHMHEGKFDLAEKDFAEALNNAHGAAGVPPEEVQKVNIVTGPTTGPTVFYQRGQMPQKPTDPAQGPKQGNMAISHSRHEEAELAEAAAAAAAADAYSAGKDAHLPMGDAERAQGKFDAAFGNFEQATKLGNYKGLARTAEMYKKGEGRPVDYVQALSRLYIARKKGVAGLDVKIGHLEKRLTPEDISKAYDLAARD